MQLFASLTAKTPARKTKSGKSADNKSEYRAVEVDVKASACCAAVKNIEGNRYLSNEVPMLPLDDCDASDCKCSYKLLDDRRCDMRRESDVAFDMASQFCKEDKRTSHLPGRRDYD